MNFSSFEKVSSGNLIYFKNDAPIENAGTLKFYKDNASGNFLKKEFRWSFNRNHWSSWETLNIGNIAKINTGDNRYLFFEIKYTMTSPTAGKVSSFSVEYVVNPQQTYAPPVEDVTSMDENHILPDGCNDLGGTTKTFKTIEISDAQTLCGKSCDYYLWRPNHSGTQPISSIEGLQSIINRLDSSIKGEVNYQSSLDPDTIMIQTIGGFPAGTTVSDLDGNPLSSLWDQLLFPTGYPEFINPDNSFSDNIASIQEIGTDIDIIFTASFNRGSINPQYSASSPYRSGLPNTYTYTGTGISGSVSSTSLTDSRTLSDYIVLSGVQSWTNTVSYDAGVQPKDSKGNDYMSPLPSGTTSVKTTSFEGVYPLFGTTIDISVLTKQPLISMITGNNIEMDLVAESGGYKHSFEIPDIWLSSRPLVGVLQFNNTGQWEYPGGSALSSLLIWTATPIVKSLVSGNINYTKYTYNLLANRSLVQIRLVF